MSATFLKASLGIGLIGVAVAFLRPDEAEGEDEAIARGEGVVEPSMARSITTSDGHSYEYKVYRATEGRIFAGIGGLFVGLISTGSARPTHMFLSSDVGCRPGSRWPRASGS